MSDPVAPRYAVYFAPLDAWWQAGSCWLGRCARSGQALPQPTIPGITAERLAQLTAEPRRYGWHATLKAPFRLAPHVSQSALCDALAELARRYRRFCLGPLSPVLLDRFLALAPEDQTRIADLAAACVRQLQPLAAPLSEAELARRRAATLDRQAEILLQRWGYPFVMERFRCHLSLTGPLDDAPTINRLITAAQRHFVHLPPCHCDGLTLFVEAQPQAPFRVLTSVGFS